MTKQNTETPEMQPEQKSTPKIPDKFKDKSGDLNADALVKSYLELEKKMAARAPLDPADICPEKPEDYEIQIKKHHNIHLKVILSVYSEQLVSYYYH